MDSLDNTFRHKWLDFASGVMILWMIVYHVIGVAWCYKLNDYWHVTDLSLLPENVYAFINNDGELEALNPCIVFPYLHFFMPWFFYKSGQFFQKRSPREIWKKDSKKLLRNFVIWSFIGYVFFLLFGLLNNSLTLRGATYSIARGLFLRGYIPINGPLWFLLTLFIVRFVGNYLLPKRGSRHYILRLISVVLLGYIVSYLAYRCDYRLLPYWVANSAAGLSFFSVGYAWGEYEEKWLVIPCVIVYFVCCFVGFPMVDMMFNKLLNGEYLLWIPVALCCIIVFNTICRILYKFIHIYFIEWIGKNAILLYVSHFIILQVGVFVLLFIDNI